jgi:hypothetical protein
MAVKTVNDYAAELEMRVHDLLSASAHDMASSIMGWTPETDEDEDDIRYEPYWVCVSSATQSILGAIIARSVNWQVEQ